MQWKSFMTNRGKSTSKTGGMHMGSMGHSNVGIRSGSLAIVSQDVNTGEAGCHITLYSHM